MARKIRIEGVEFEVIQKGYYAFFSGSRSRPDVMIVQEDVASFDCYIHPSAGEEVLDMKMVRSKEAAVRWAKAKNYLL